MPPETEIRFRCGDIHLDGRMSAPRGATKACVICHPHPLYGGDMHSAVVVSIAQALAEGGVATLRFDFRGAGTSGGVHGGGLPEIEDARAAVDALTASTGLSRVAIVGYSFGALVAMNLAFTDDRIRAVAAVAPPTAMPGLAIPTSTEVPLLILAGDCDSYCPPQNLESLASGDDRAKITILAGADHFFTGREREVARMVGDFLDGT